MTLAAAATVPQRDRSLLGGNPRRDAAHLRRHPAAHGVRRGTRAAITARRVSTWPGWRRRSPAAFCSDWRNLGWIEPSWLTRFGFDGGMLLFALLLSSRVGGSGRRDPTRQARRARLGDRRPHGHPQSPQLRHGARTRVGRAGRVDASISAIAGNLVGSSTFQRRLQAPRRRQALRRVASALSHALNRPADVVARFGGEEFRFVVLPDTDASRALHVATALQAAVGALGIRLRPSPGARMLSLSLGIATARPPLGADPHSVGGVRRPRALPRQGGDGTASRSPAPRPCAGASAARWYVIALTSRIETQPDLVDVDPIDALPVAERGTAEEVTEFERGLDVPVEAERLAFLVNRDVTSTPRSFERTSPPNEFQACRAPPRRTRR
ncbi:MAG: diguanylate cyclase [bacterium]